MYALTADQLPPAIAAPVIPKAGGKEEEEAEEFKTPAKPMKQELPSKDYSAQAPYPTQLGGFVDRESVARERGQFPEKGGQFYEKGGGYEHGGQYEKEYGQDKYEQYPERGKEYEHGKYDQYPRERTQYEEREFQPTEKRGSYERARGLEGTTDYISAVFVLTSQLISIATYVVACDMHSLKYTSSS